LPTEALKFPAVPTRVPSIVIISGGKVGISVILRKRDFTMPWNVRRSMSFPNEEFV
jgi:hypothetical protein